MGAVGVAVAHSGTVLSILLDPADPGVLTRIDLLFEELGKIGITRVLRFQV
jgi:uncharacterized protein involved in propanediol utilization